MGKGETNTAQQNLKLHFDTVSVEGLSKLFHQFHNCVLPSKKAK